MSYSMSYTWYDVTGNFGICKSKLTLGDTSYHIRRMTGWALSYCGMRVAGCALYHKVILHCDVNPRYTVTSLRVTLSHDFSPERLPAIRHIHVNMIWCLPAASSDCMLCVTFRTLGCSSCMLAGLVWFKLLSVKHNNAVLCKERYFVGSSTERRARRKAVGWRIALRAGISRVRFPIVSLT